MCSRKVNDSNQYIIEEQLQQRHTKPKTQIKTTYSYATDVHFIHHICNDFTEVHCQIPYNMSSSSSSDLQRRVSPSGGVRGQTTGALVTLKTSVMADCPH